MARWPRMTLALPVDVDLEIRITMPRNMTPAEWSHMLELLEAMRPGIVKEPADTPTDKPDMIPRNVDS